MAEMTDPDPIKAAVGNPQNQHTRLVSFLFAGLVILLLFWPGEKGPTTEMPPRGWRHFFPNDQVLALVRQAGKLWSGGREGLHCFDWGTGMAIPVPGGSPEFTMVEALAIDASGTLWVGHDYGLHALSEGSWKEYTAHLPSPKVLSLVAARDGSLWVGTWQGAAHLVGNSWSHVNSAHGLIADRVRVLFQDSAGGLWFGTSVAPAGGLSHLSGTNWTQYSTRNILPHNNVAALFEDREKQLWIGSGFFDTGGLTVFPGWASDSVDGHKIFRKADGLAGEKCRSVFQDRDGVYWFGSELDGLARWDGTNREILTIADGLPGNEVMAMLQDPDGNLWLGTDKGVGRIASTTLLSWVKKRKTP